MSGSQLCDQWRAASMSCAVCNKDWVGVMPADVLLAECPQFGTLCDVPDALQELSEESSRA